MSVSVLLYLRGNISHLEDSGYAQWYSDKQQWLSGTKLIGGIKVQKTRGVAGANRG